LPRACRGPIIGGLIAQGEVSDAVARIVEEALSAQLSKPRETGADSHNRGRIAEIINNLEEAIAEEVMQSLSEARPEDAVALKTMLFAFNDLTRLSQRARALLFDKVPTDVVVMALRGTETGFRDTVLSSLGARTRRLVESELANGANPPAREIAAARRKITQTVLGMAQRNEIELAPAPSEAAA
jgi:flagellar motor switch protein FliG